MFKTLGKHADKHTTASEKESQTEWVGMSESKERPLRENSEIQKKTNVYFGLGK